MNNTFGLKTKAQGEEANQKVRLTEVEKIENFLRNDYVFRYNEVTGRIEFTEFEQDCFTPISDYHINSMSLQATKAGLNCSSNYLRTILNSSFSTVYTPFEEYFNGLPKWDFTTDYIFQLSSTIKTTNDPFWHLSFKKWVVAAVACVLDESVTNQTVIVLNGPQGIGKTTWLERLLPKPLKSYIYSGVINPENKDTLIHLSETIFINMDELETLNRKDLNSLKETITKSNIRFRRPYGHNSENLARRASLIGSVNSAEFLSDTTGNRRFLCFETQEIDHKHNIELDKVYAQALHLYQNNFQYWFDGAEIATIDINNEKFRTVSVEEELLLQNFSVGSQEEGDEFKTTTQIIQWLIDQGNSIQLNDTSKRRFGQALTRHKFVKGKKRGVHGYYVRYGKTENNVLGLVA